MISIAAAAVAFLHAQTVTINEPAIRLDRLLSRIGAQTGRDLRCAEVFKDDYVLLAAADQPVEEVLERIGELVKGDWEVSNGYTFLTQRRRVDDSGEAEKQFAEKYRIFLDGIKLEDYDEAHVRNLYEDFIDLQKLPSEQHYKEGHRFLYAAPSTRAVIKMLKAIGPEKLASIPDQRQVVFASHPTRLQEPMPAGWESVVEQLKQEDDLRIKLRQEYEPRIGSSYPAQASAFARRPMQDRPGPEPSDIWFIVRRRGEQMLGSFSFYDGKGQRLMPIHLPEILPFFGIDLLPKAVPAFTDVQGEFAFSEDAVKWWRWLIGTEEERDDYPGELIRPVLMQETERDPLSFGISELLHTVAQNSGRPVLALVDDDLMRLRAADQKPVELSILLQTLKTTGDLVLQEQGNWLVAAPVSLSDTRARRIDRDQVATYLRGLERDAELSVRRLVNMAANVGTEVRLQKTLEYAEHGRSRSVRSGIPRRLLPLLILAHLDGPSQTRVLRGEETTLNYAGLNPKARSFVEEMLFSGKTFADTTQANARKALREPPAFFAGERTYSSGMRSEPSYLLAQPEASAVTVTLSYQIEHAFLIRRQKGEGGAGNIEPISESLIRIERGDDVPDNPMLFAYEPVGYLQVNVAAGPMIAPDSSYFRLRPGQSERLPGPEAMKRYKKFFDEARQRAAEPP